MVRRAAETATEGDIAELRALVERQQAAVGDAVAFIRADIAFHTRIAAISGNPIYTAVSETMLNWLQEYHAHMLIWQGKSERTLAEHAKIVDRIAAHDPEGAGQAMTSHLDRSNHLYVHSHESRAG
jgi:DNA-binding FadR family transcriptional regulator